MIFFFPGLKSSEIKSCPTCWALSRAALSAPAEKLRSWINQMFHFLGSPVSRAGKTHSVRFGSVCFSSLHLDSYRRKCFILAAPAGSARLGSVRSWTWGQSRFSVIRARISGAVRGADGPPRRAWSPDPCRIGSVRFGGRCRSELFSYLSWWHEAMQRRDPAFVAQLQPLLRLHDGHRRYGKPSPHLVWHPGTNTSSITKFRFLDAWMDRVEKLSVSLTKLQASQKYSYPLK